MKTDFEYCVPTHIYFGQNQLENLGQELKKHGKNVLVVMGSPRVKSTQWYKTVVEQINNNGMQLFEFQGVEPNPRSYSVNQVADICKKEKIDVLLPIGGGSVVDCAKLASAAAYYEGDAWDLVIKKAQMTKFLPVVVISTISGTGTDMDAYGIVSNPKTEEKLPFYHPNLYPAATFLDPTITYSVSPYQTACGAIDAFSHYLEVYFMKDNLYVLRRIMEGFMKTILHFLPIAINEPENYEARANIMWASSWALNGFTYGPTGGTPFAMHWIEDELSAKYDITHGLGLAIVMPHYLEYCLNEKSVQMYYEFGVNVLDISPDLDKMDVAKLSIEKLKDLFFNICNLKPGLSDYVQIDETKFDEMAKIACRNDKIEGFVTLTQEDVKNILKRCI